MRYQVIVGNIGTTLSTNNGAQALREFGRWRALSMELYGRASNEEVTLMRDGQVWYEHVPKEVEHA